MELEKMQEPESLHVRCRGGQKQGDDKWIWRWNDSALDIPDSGMSGTSLINLTQVMCAETFPSRYASTWRCCHFLSPAPKEGTPMSAKKSRPLGVQVGNPLSR